MGTYTRSLSEAQALATFALHTGAFVIAEGIEDDYTLDILRDLEQERTDSHAIVQGGQGYGLGKPSPKIDIELPASLRPLSHSA